MLLICRDQIKASNYVAAGNEIKHHYLDVAKYKLEVKKLQLN